MRQVIQFNPKDNAEDIKLALMIIYQGHNKIHDFVEKDGMTIMVVEVDAGVIADLEKFGFKVLNIPER